MIVTASRVLTDQRLAFAVVKIEDLVLHAIDFDGHIASGNR
jgi:hypothetical protein